MTFIIRMDLRDYPGTHLTNPSMFVTANRTLYNSRDPGTVVWTTQQREIRPDGDGIFNAVVPSTDQVVGSYWFKLQWTGSHLRVNIPGQPSGAVTGVASWINEPALPLPEVPALTQRVIDLEARPGGGGGSTITPDPDHPGFFLIGESA